ncbi:MAG: hypothetical protein ACREX9_21970 [Gammaproteobacteria bacterium]
MELARAEIQRESKIWSELTPKTLEVTVSGKRPSIRRRLACIYSRVASQFAHPKRCIATKRRLNGLNNDAVRWSASLATRFGAY